MSLHKGRDLGVGVCMTTATGLMAPVTTCLKSKDVLMDAGFCRQVASCMASRWYVADASDLECRCAFSCLCAISRFDQEPFDRFLSLEVCSSTVLVAVTWCALENSAT